MKKIVWDTSALLNIKEPDATGYSPGHSLMKDLTDGWIPGPYLNIYPSIAIFELNASVSRAEREGRRVLRDFYIFDRHSKLVSIDSRLMRRCSPLFTKAGFDRLRGADLIFACIAYLESAFLVTLDNHFEIVASDVRAINLNASKTGPNYRRSFEKEF